MKKFFILMLTCSLNNYVNATTLPIIKDSDLVGITKSVKIKKNDTFFNIARESDIGFLELLEANPNVNPKKLIAGNTLVLPTAYILPSADRSGMIINLAELRIYYFHPDSNLVSTYPVGIGRKGWKTPIGETKITRKRKHPTWTPPDSIRRAAARKGKTYPKVVPAGPDNPLGDYAMNLSWPRFLIHGTNVPKSVGLRSSSGCIRMYPEDVEDLFNKIKLNTKVIVVHQPYKVGWRNNNLYLEAHDPLPESYYGFDTDVESELEEVINEIVKNKSYQIKWQFAKKEIHQTIGLPIKIN